MCLLKILTSYFSSHKIVFAGISGILRFCSRAKITRVLGKKEWVGGCSKIAYFPHKNLVQDLLFKCKQNQKVEISKSLLIEVQNKKEKKTEQS